MGMKALKADFNNKLISKPDFIVRMHDCHKVLFEYADFIRNTDIQKIEVVDGQVVTTSREHGIKMVCDPTDRRIAPIETLNFGHYEKEECDMILRLVKDGQNIFDIGGNFGWYSLVIAKKKKVNLFPFEPVPRTYGYLQQNVALNGVDNIELFNFGFSDQAQELKFFYYPEESGNASIANLSGTEGVQSIVCQVRRLDDFVQEHDARLDFIKCDVEGAELLVFKGGLQSISRDKPVIFAELLRKWSAKFNYHPNEVVELFRGIGYRCFTVHEEKLVPLTAIDEQTVETNFFFLHGEKHKTEIEALAVAL